MEQQQLQQQVIQHTELLVHCVIFALGSASSFCRTARDNDYRDWVNLLSIACVAGFSSVATVAIYRHYFGTGGELSGVDVAIALSVGLTGKTADKLLSAIYEKVISRLIDVIIASRQKN